QIHPATEPHRCGCPQVHRRVHLLPDPLWARHHAAVRRQGEEHRSLASGELHPAAPGNAEMSHATAPTGTDLRRKALEAPAGTMLMVGAILAVVGLGIFVILLAGNDPGRAWRSFHINFLFFTGLSLGSIVFAAIQKLSQG